MARALWLVDTLENAGLTVHPFKDWESRGQTTFAPTGVMWHHTVTRPTTADPTIDHFLAITGSSTVAAPLCNYSTNRDGSVSVIAAGTANHGGTGVWKGISGNRYWFGDEMKNLGTSKEPWPKIQLDAARTAAAAVLKHLGKPAGMLVAHKEYATPAGRKSDPHTLNMNAERLLVAQLIEGDDMAVLTDAEQKELQDFLKAISASGSNVGFVTQCIEDIREKNTAGGYATRVHTHPGVPGGGLTHADVVAIINGSQIVAPT